MMRSLFVGFMLIATITSFATDGPIKLWYQQPAKKWDAEALPIGNGRMGAMLFSDIKTEHIQFNEQSLWSGDNNWDGGYQTGDRGFGSYRNFGEFVIEFHHADSAKAYRRELNITTGVHTTTFEINGTKYTREAFASYPDQVMVFRYRASKKGAFSGKVSIVSAQGASNTASANALSLIGEMPNHLKYAARLQLLNAGGTLRVEGNELVFQNCSTLIFYLDARTNYKPDYYAGWRGADPMPLVVKEIATAQKMGFQKILDRHIKDIKRLTAAATVDIGQTQANILTLPTDIRLKKYAAGGNDPDLEAASNK